MAPSPANIFKFKQFAVDQSGCAMKINTDGVLLGVFAKGDEPLHILDIGTGTGVIALMLAQRYPKATVDAVEIYWDAAETAKRNFASSPFAERLTLYPQSFEDYFAAHHSKKYDLIVSNPPFYTDSLTSPEKRKNIAKHARADFFIDLFKRSSSQLTDGGLLWLVLPLNTGELVKNIARNIGLDLHRIIDIHSFKESEPHRQILAFGLRNRPFHTEKFVIYHATKTYSADYKMLLANFFIVF